MIKIIASVFNTGILSFVSPDLYTIQQIQSSNPVSYEIAIDSKTFLSNQGLTYGNYNITYYVIDDETILNTSFIIQSVNMTRLQCSARLSNSVPIQNIKKYQDDYNLVSQQTKLLLVQTLNLGIKNVSVVEALKYNYFDNLMFFRFNTVSLIQKQKICKAYKLVYQPINVDQFIEVSTTEIQPVPFSRPHIYSLDYNTTALYTQSLSSILTSYGTSSDFITSITEQTIANDIMYNTTDPSNFVHFGSNISRLQTFVNKYNAISASYNSTDNSVYTNSSTYRKQIANNIIKGFTYYQKDLFTKFVGQDNLVSQSIPNIDINILSQLVTSASAYDNGNIHALINFIPEGIKIQQNNADFLTMVELIGNTFDQYWAAIRQVSSINNKFEMQLQNYSVGFLREYVKNLGGIEFISPYSTKNLYEAYYTQLQYFTTSVSAISVTEYEKIILSRLIANMPFLLRSKGTKTCAKQILNIYGFSERLISIKEFHNNAEVYNMTSNIVASNLTLTGSNTASIQFSPDSYTAVIIDFKYRGVSNYQIFNFSSSSQTMSVADYNINNLYIEEPLTTIMYSYDGIPQVRLYNHAPTPQIIWSSSVSPYIQLLTMKNISVDTIRVVSASAWNGDNLSIYLSGTNIVDDMDNVAVMYDFKNVIPAIKTTTGITVNYSNDNIILDETNTVLYSSIFDSHQPANYYKIGEPRTFTDSSGSQQGTKSGINIGTNYSDQFNNLFVHDAITPIFNYIQNNKHQRANNESFKEFYRTTNKRLNINPAMSYQSVLKFNEQIDSSVIKMVKDFNPAYLNIHYGTVLQNPIYYRNRISTVDMTTSKILPELNDVVNVNSATQLNHSAYFPRITTINNVITIATPKSNISSPLASRPIIIESSINSETSTTPNSVFKINSYVSAQQLKYITGQSARNNNYLRKINSGYNYNYGIQTREINMRELFRLSRLSGSSVETRYYNSTVYYTNDGRSQFLYYNINRGNRDGSVKILTYVRDRKLIIDQGSGLTVTSPVRL